MENVLEKAKQMAGVRLSTRGQDLFQKSLVEIKNVHQDDYQFMIKDDREEYIVDVSFESDFQYHCSCEYNSVTSAVCEHIVAALHFVEHNKDVVKFVNKNVKYLLDNYRNKLIIQAQVLIDDEKLQIEPTFEIKEQMMSLFYRVGYNKKYIIRDIHQFLDAIQNESLYPLYENESIYLSIDKFSDASKKLIDMLRSRHTMKQLDFYKKSDGNRNFIVKGRNLDSFFAYGYQYPVKMKKEEKVIVDMEFIPKYPKITLSFEKIGNRYYLHHNVNFEVIDRGNYGLYLLQDHIFYKGNVQYANLMEPLLRTLNNQPPLEINEDILFQFYNQVLKQVSEYVCLEGEIMEELIHTTYHLKLHLDIDKKGYPYFTFFKEIDQQRFHLIQDTGIVTPEILLIIDILKNYIRKSVGDQHYIGDSHEEFYEFVNEVIPKISSYVDIFVSDKVRAIRLKRVHAVNIGVSFNNGLLDLNINFNDFSSKEIKKIIDAYREKRKFYRLKDGSFLNLEDEKIEQFVEFVDDLGIDSNHIETKMQIDAFKALYINKKIQDNSLIQFTQNKSYTSLVDEIQDIKDTVFEIPKPLEHVLRDYQKYGYRWLKTMQKYHFGAILADDMGIGKTIQVLALLSEKQPLPSIVICPSSILFNWKNEMERFTPYLKCLVVAGNVTQRHQSIATIQSYDIIITSYDYLKRDIEQYENIEFHYQVLDEAQYIKNFNTKNAVSVKQIQSNYRLALTGTPIENSLAELWSIMDFLMPNYLHDYYEFKQNYELPIVKEQDTTKQKRLAQLISPFILRRLKKDVVKELPEKIETEVFVEFSEEEKQLYVAKALEMKESLRKQDNKIYILSMLTKLRQLCNEPRLLYENIHEMSSKMNACMDIIHQSISNNKKILLFSQFTGLLDLVQQQLNKENIKNYYLSGATPKIQRHQMVSAFNEDDTQVFLISLKAGGTGLNLTGAEVVIHFDPWWNISAQNQASDRAYRIGQDKVVQVFKLIMKDSIEEKILNIQSRKKELADAIIEENSSSILSMNTDEILDLF